MNIQEQIPNAGSSAGPGFCIYDGKPFLAWKGEGSDAGIYYSTASTLTPNSDGQYTWAAQTHVAGVGASDGPAVASRNGVLCMAWKGEGSDPAIYCSVLNGKSWSPQQKLTAATSHAPALAALSSDFLMTWKGESDSQIFYSTSPDGKTWTPQQQIAGIGTSSTPALAAASNGGAYMAWKGDSDNRLFWSKYDGKTWSAQQLITAGASTGPAIVDDGNAVNWLCWKAANGNAVYLCSLVDEAKNEWSPQTVRYGIGTSDRPALISTGGGASGIVMAWKGESSADLLYGMLELPVPATLTYNYPRTNIGRGSSSSMAIEAQLVLNQNGSCDFTGTFFNEAVLKESWYITMAVKDGMGHAYAFSTSGDIGPGTQPWNLSTTNIAIAQNWTGIAINNPSGRFAIHAGDTDDIGASILGALSDLGVPLEGAYQIFEKIAGGSGGEAGSEPSAE